MVAKFDWSNEKAVNDVIDLAARGRTSTEIAQIIGASRGSVMGFCRRNGIELISRRKDQKLIAALHTPKSKKKVVRLPNAITKPPKEVPESRPCPLEELNYDKCHFPLWGPDTPASDRRYCGAWTPNQIYCVGHQSVVWLPVSRRASTGRSG